MPDWSHVERDLAAVDYEDFEFDSGKTAVPGLSGEWLVGKIDRQGPLKRENLSLRLRLWDALPGVASIPTEPEYAPANIREIAARHELDVVLISAGRDWVRVALVAPESASTS
ncbi:MULTISPECIES: hypothetical protein [unclassified Haladaptatus]|uniref:hypothetical protein n=1 Tax=unclassified Haladaptatus TaxID=2622732 RepID=UPI0023E84B86|nr:MULTISPECIES: hypothetical protein [unclassified Haladaptatus]